MMMPASQQMTIIHVGVYKDSWWTDLLHSAWSTEWRVHKLLDWLWLSKWFWHRWCGCSNNQVDFGTPHAVYIRMLLPLVVESVVPAPVKHLPLFHISSLISFMICNILLLYNIMWILQFLLLTTLAIYSITGYLRVLIYLYESGSHPWKYYSRLLPAHIHLIKGYGLK